MSSSRDHSSFTGVPGICLAISTAWRHVVVEGAAPAEAAAEVDLVDVALVGRQAGRRQRRGERGLAVLRRHPHLALVGACSAPWRSSAPSARGSGTDRRRPPRPSSPRRRCAAFASPFLLPTKACSASRPAFSMLGDRGARDLGVRALVPDDRQRVERGLGLPPGVGDDGDGGVADLHDLLHARHARRPWRRRSSSPCRRTPGSP